MPRLASCFAALIVLLAPALAAAQPVASIGNVSCPEGDPTVFAQCLVPVRLSAAPTQRVIVRFDTQFISGGATADDVDAVQNLSIAFDPGDPATINVVLDVYRDYRIEPNERLRLVLSNPVNATLGTATAELTLINDDTAGTYSVQAGPVSHAEGIGQVTLTVQRSGQADGTSVNFALGGTVAVDEFFHEGGNTGTLLFAGGETSRTLDVRIIDDAVDEEDESLEFRLSSPTGGATLGNAVGVHRIVDDDPTPEMYVSRGGCVTSEGDSGTRACTFEVNLFNPSSRTVTFRSRTTAITASADNDFTAQDWTARTIVAGQTRMSIMVLVRGDLEDEADERFALDFDSPVNAVFPVTRAFGDILDDDDPTGAGLLRFSLPYYSVGEENTAVLVVERTGGRAGSVSVRYTTSNATAKAPADYAATSGVLQFADGQITETITIPIVGDALHENLEGFSIHLDNATGGVGLHAPNWTSVLIVDDDPAPTLSVDHGGCDVIEGDFGTWACALVLRLSAVSGRPVNFNARTIDGNATDGIDYIGLAPLASVIPAGESRANFVVPVIGDFLVEPDETFTLRVRDVTGAIPANALNATVRILDDDSVDLMHFDGFE